MQTRRLLAAAAVLLSCAPKSADTNGDTGSSSASTDGAEGGSATDTAPTTTAEPMTSLASSSAEGSATATATSASMTSGDDTDAEPGGGLPGACAAVCMRWEMCSPGTAGTPEQCVAGCISGAEVPSACAMALAAQWSCVAGLACEEALKFLTGEGGPPTMCLEPAQEADQVCEDVGCNGEIGGGEDTCELEQDCGGKRQNYRCDSVANTCTCTEDDVPGKECPADGFCTMDSAEQRAAITACCGWEWM